MFSFFSLGHLGVCAKSLQSSPTLQPCGRQPASFLCPWNSPGRNTGVGCHSLLQGIFPTQGQDRTPASTSPASAGRFFTTSATFRLLVGV